ncbi:NADP-dependent oxidoreductase domain-containing protein [Xylaria sp. CBS 124048]|nr:NADP-dependent oxidoreductase domain-containing protein [Xylaria sp. CBS 124048]
MPLIASTPKDRIILGLMTFGPDAASGTPITDMAEFKRVLDRFQERGYNEVDTARVYGGRAQEGFTREAGWKERGLTLATKFQYPNSPGDSKGESVVQSLETSLKELGTECVDICYLHAADRSVPFQETLEAVDKLHKAGKFVRFGLSNFTAAEVAEIVMICKYNGWVRPTIYQAMYNAITRGIEAELIPACRRYGLQIVVYNPIAGGLFSGKVKSVDMNPETGRFSLNNPSGANYRKRYFKESNFRALQMIEKAIEKHPGLTIIETALRWTVHHSALKIKNGGGDGILIGISSFAQLDSNLDNLEKGPLPEDVVKALDAAWMVSKADAPNYWHLDLKYEYDTQAALFGPGANLSLSRCSSPGQQQSDGSPRGTEPGEVSGTQRNTSSASSSSPSGTDNSDDDDDDDDHDDPDDMAGRSRPSSRQARAPLLEKVEDRERGRKRTLEDIKDLEAQDALTPQSQVVTALSPDVADAAIVHPPSFSRTSTVRSHSPTVESHAAARKKYLLAAVFLVVSLVSFVLQTELGRYVQHELGWNKAYCMLYLTHGSWSLLWPAQLLVLRLQKRQMSWQAFWRRHVDLLRSTAHMVAEQQLDVPHAVLRRSPVPYMVRTTAFVTSCLTIAGLTWYVAVNMTSPSDLTAIYNCSAFFAYAFSVPLLKEKLRLDKSLAVLVAVIGVLVVAYGDSVEGDADAASGTSTRLLGNLIIGAGSVLYGLYEVLYKRFACPPEGTSAWRGVIFANTFGSCIGSFTLLVFWIPLPILHVLGWETFEIPTGETALYLWTSVIMNAVFAGSFLVLISLTSPVLSSVAALLTIFIVAIADWLITGQALSFSALVGGAMIIVAFLVLSWSTWREMTEDAREKGGHSKNGGGGGGVYQEAPMDWDSEEDDDDGHVS